MIITNETILRAPCLDATLEEAPQLIQALELELKLSAEKGRSGVGLACPQIGLHKRVALVRLGREYNFNLVNATITKSYDEKMFREEGCLSFPGRIENTMRFQEIVVSENLVYPHSFIATGLLSVVIQHELDHLSGILLPDRTLPLLPKQRQIEMAPNDPCFCGSKNKFKRCHGKLK